MQRTLSIFRSLIVIGLILSILGASIDFIVPSLVPQVLSNAHEQYASEDPSFSLVLVTGGLTLMVFVAAIIATIGLMLLKRWARSLALWTTLLSVLTYPFLGAMIYSGWALMLLESAMIMWGAVLAMAYFSELRTHFGNHDR